MHNGLIIIIVILIFFIFFIFYKRDMLIKMFSLNVDTNASQFQEQLQQTADAVIKRLENQIAHLELLLEEADEKIAHLDAQLKQLELNKAIAASPPFFERLTATEFEREAIIQEPQHLSKAAPASPLAGDNLTNDKRKLIIAMADQGYSVTEIAKATGFGKGEIMLLLQLNKR